MITGWLSNCKCGQPKLTKKPDPKKSKSTKATVKQNNTKESVCNAFVVTAATTAIVTINSLTVK